MKQMMMMMSFLGRHYDKVKQKIKLGECIVLICLQMLYYEERHNCVSVCAGQTKVYYCKSIHAMV